MATRRRDPAEVAALNAGRRLAVERRRPRLVTTLHEREVVLRDGTVLTERWITIEEVS